jgi:hypothetical protein
MRTVIKNKKFVLLFIILITTGSLIALELTDTTHLLHPATKVSKPSAPYKSLPNKTNSNLSENAPRSNNGVTQQTATDRKGQAPNEAINDQNKWTVSESGLITLKLPAANGSLKSSDSIYGSAQVDKVQYRLIDDQVGVVSQGFISVVNGNFSASVNFKPYASSGRLDVFSTDPSGKELNEVQVPVNF